MCIYTTMASCKVIILPKNLNASNYYIIKYKFPESDQFFNLMINHDCTELFELNKYSNENASFFIDDHVKSDASAYFVTKIDSLLLLLPYFEHIAMIAFPAQTSFNLNDLLSEPQLENIHSIVQYAINKKVNLECICDYNSIDNKFILNESKTLKFLRSKFEKVHEAIKSQFADIDNRKWYAFDVLAPYLSDNFRTKLMQECDVNSLCGVIKRKANSNFDNNDNRNEIVKRPKVDKHTKHAKKLQEAAKGSKLITSFFKKS